MVLLSQEHAGNHTGSWQQPNQHHLQVYVTASRHGTDIVPSACRPEMVVGWYHSHPGFGCWLSGTDINTQQVRCCTSVMGMLQAPHADSLTRLNQAAQ